MEVVYISLEKFFNITDKTSQIELKALQHEAGRFIVKFVGEQIYNFKDCKIVTIDKKPQFKFENLKFSITHSNKIVAVVFDENECAIDAEFFIQRDLKKFENRYQKKFNSMNDFYEFWTTYEAKIKFKKSEFFKKSFEFKNEYFMTILSEKNIEKIKFFEIFKNENSEIKIKQIEQL